MEAGFVAGVEPRRVGQGVIKHLREGAHRTRVVEPLNEACQLLAPAIARLDGNGELRKVVHKLGAKGGDVVL